PSVDRATGHGEIRYRFDQLGPGVQDVYVLRPELIRSGIPSLVPAEDTFGALLLRTPPLHLITAIYQDLLTPGDRKLWQDNLRRMGHYGSIEEFFAEFADKLGNTAGIAVGRVSEVFDRVDYPDWYSDPDENPDASFAALGTAMVVRLREGMKPQELDAYLASKIPLLGASDELEKVDYRGLTYTRIRLKHEIADFALVKPAYILAQDHFIFCSNESYFLKILDAIVDPDGSPPLAVDDTFLAMAETLPEEAHVALFVDLEKLFRIPADASPGGQPRGFMWDRRNLWVIANRDERTEAIRYRNERRVSLSRDLGRQLTAEEQMRIEDDVEAHVQQWRTRYEEFLEEYRQELEGFRRLRALGVTFSADRQTVVGDVTLLLQPNGGR
ncbi:MAG: hypothetical protein ACYTG6_10020, partial [Planctomycetota bacterium]